MAWVIRIILVLGLGLGGFLVWDYSRSIPYGFKTSPLAWSDQWQSSRAFDAIDHLADEATLTAQYNAWAGLPATPRAMARQQLGSWLHWADGKGDVVEIFDWDNGPNIQVFLPYPLDSQFEPVTDIDTREAFLGLLECDTTPWTMDPATSFDMDAWVAVGAPPAELLGLADAGDLDAQYDLGLGATYLEDGPQARALAPWLQRAADAGHTEAMTLVGAIALGNTFASAADNARGLDFLEAAIEQGSAVAMSYAAHAQPREGEDLSAFAQKRLEWDMQAAAACEPGAVGRIGWRLVFGRGLPRDHDLGMDLAVHWYTGANAVEWDQSARLTKPS